MSDIVQTQPEGPFEATPKAELERQIMDPNIPKMEREWWAADEITRLRAEVEKLRAALERIVKLDDEWVPEAQDDYSYSGYQTCADIARAALEEK